MSPEETTFCCRRPCEGRNSSPSPPERAVINKMLSPRYCTVNVPGHHRSTPAFNGVDRPLYVAGISPITQPEEPRQIPDRRLVTDALKGQHRCMANSRMWITQRSTQHLIRVSDLQTPQRRRRVHSNPPMLIAEARLQSGARQVITEVGQRPCGPSPWPVGEPRTARVIQQTFGVTVSNVQQHLTPRGVSEIRALHRLDEEIRQSLQCAPASKTPRESLGPHTRSPRHGTNLPYGPVA